VERRKIEDCQRGDYAAMESFVCSLGEDLIAFKFGHRASSKEEAEVKLSIALGWAKWRLKFRTGQCDRIARCALMEWVFDSCPTCKGAKEIPNYSDTEGRQPMKPCTECHGTGLRHYGDQERAEVLGEAHAKAMGVAHTVISWGESLAVRMVKQRLERL
jgi:hypothetical protein